MTDSDAKEWVTVKLPKEVRDAAQDDPRTYGEIMRDGLADDSALRVSEEHRAKEIVDAVREELDTDPYPREEGVELGDLREQLDRIESAAKEATNAAQSADRKLEDLR